MDVHQETATMDKPFLQCTIVFLAKETSYADLSDTTNNVWSYIYSNLLLMYKVTVVDLFIIHVLRYAHDKIMFLLFTIYIK